MKEQILDFEITRDFFIEMKYLKQIVGMLDFVILDIDLTLREKCPHTVFFLVHIQSECRKIRPRKTPYLDSFHAMLLSIVIGYDHETTQHVHCIMLSSFLEKKLLLLLLLNM